MRGRISSMFGGAGIVLAAAFVATGCGGGGNGATATAPGDDLAKEQRLVMNIVGEPATIDPPKVADVESANVTNQMFAGLYRIVGEESELTPYLAAELPEISDDGLTYTVRLRDDARWSNGEPITAEDVRYGVLRSLDPETGAYYASFMHGIVGACEYNSSGGGKDAPDPKEVCGEVETKGTADEVGVTAVDEHTVEFRLKRAVPWFDQLLSLHVFYPQPQDAIEQHGDKWTAPENIVTSGAFTLESRQPRQQITLVKNDEFWNADDVTLETVEMRMVGDAQTAYRQFTRGELDTGAAGSMVAPEDIDEARADDRYLEVETTATNYMYLNTRNEKLQDPRVRRGIAMAINRQGIVENITRKGDVPLATVVATTMPGYETVKEGQQDFIVPEESPDVDAARELLEEGGWTEGTPLNLYFTTESASAEAIGTAIQSDLRRVGVRVRLVPIASFSELIGPGIGTSPVEERVDAVLLGWGADYLDPQNYYQLFTCEQVQGGLNTANYCNEEFDEFYQEAIRTVDRDARFEIYRQMEAMLTGPEGEFPVAPLYQPRDNTMVQDYVEGFGITPLSYYFLDDVRILSH